MSGDCGGPVVREIDGNIVDRRDWQTPLKGTVYKVDGKMLCIWGVRDIHLVDVDINICQVQWLTLNV